MAADQHSAMIWTLIGIIVLLVHFTPSFIAYSRNHPSKGLILVLNILMGWTVIGWFALMIWVMGEEKAAG